MYFVYFKSFLFGLLIGIGYAQFFFKKLKKLFMNESILKDHKSSFLFKYTISSIITFIALISILVLLYFTIKVNLVVLLVTFIPIFWITILYKLKYNKVS